MKTATESLNTSRRSIPLTKGQLAAYNLLKERSKDGELSVVISYANIAKETSFSSAHIFKNIQTLKELNLIETTRTTPGAPLIYKIIINNVTLK